MSTKKEDFDKDMRLIAKGTHDMWMEKYADDYRDQNSKNAAYCKDNAGDKVVRNDENYQDCMNKMFTIGGVNFNEYFDFAREIEMPEKSEETDKSLKERAMERIEDNEFVKKYPYNGDMSLDEYKRYLEQVALKDWYGGDLACLKNKDYTEADREKSAKSWKEAYKKEKLNSFDANAIRDAVWYAAQTQGEHSSSPKKYQEKIKELYSEEDLNIIQQYGPEDYFEPKLPSAEEILADYNNDGTYRERKPEDFVARYKKWSEEKRVSEVQKAKVLDMNKNVIRKPDDDTRAAAKPANSNNNSNSANDTGAAAGPQAEAESAPDYAAAGSYSTALRESYSSNPERSCAASQYSCNYTDARQALGLQNAGFKSMISSLDAQFKNGILFAPEEKATPQMLLDDILKQLPEPPAEAKELPEDILSGFSPEILAELQKGLGNIDPGWAKQPKLGKETLDWRQGQLPKHAAEAKEEEKDFFAKFPPEVREEMKNQFEQLLKQRQEHSEGAGHPQAGMAKFNPMKQVEKTNGSLVEKAPKSLAEKIQELRGHNRQGIAMRYYAAQGRNMAYGR